jgi:hypothetical protein
MLAPLFSQLEILELIGQGGMGAVYKARQPSLDRLVAVKVLPAEAGQDPAFAERFNREARALARLSHPNIVAVHDVGRAGDYYYFVMEYIDGVNLRQLLRDGHLPWRPPFTMSPDWMKTSTASETFSTSSSLTFPVSWTTALFCSRASWSVRSLPGLIRSLPWMRKTVRFWC